MNTKPHHFPCTDYTTMGKSIRVLRRSLHVFFQSYNSSSTSALLIGPFSFSILLSQSLLSSSPPVLRSLSLRLHSLFEAAGFPASSAFFSLLNLKLSQDIFSFFCTLPSSLTFLLLAKALLLCRLSFSPPVSVTLGHCYRRLVLTHLFNSFVILSANAAFFSILFISFNIINLIGVSSSSSVLVLSVAGAILYSLMLAHVVAVCGLAAVVSVLEDCSGYVAVLKACVLIQGAEATAISVALPAGLGLALVEALFQYRVMKPYDQFSGKLSLALIGETFYISYMHSLLIVLNIVTSYVLYKSCRAGFKYQNELEPQDIGPLLA